MGVVFNNPESFEELEKIYRDSVDARPLDKPVKVVFISHQYTFWNNYSPVLKELAARPGKFEAAALVVPFKGYEHENVKYIKHPVKELKEQGVPIHTPQTYNIHKESPDVAFFVTPYTIQRELRYHPRMLRLQGTKSALIPYCTEFMGDEQFMTGFYGCYERLFWRSFVSSSMACEAYRHYGNTPEWHTPVTGNPEYDVVLNARPGELKKYQRIQQMAAGRKIILWSPHYKNSSGWATWEKMGLRMARMFRRYPDDIFLVMRPHQLFYYFMRKWQPGMPPQNIAEEMAKILHDSENCWVDDDYLAIESVYASDAVISDMSSMLAKAMALGKTVMYTYGTEGSGAGMAAPILTRHVHNGTDMEDVSHFLEMVIKGRPDTLLPLPEDVKTEFCGPVDGKASIRIAEYLERYFGKNGGLER